MHFRFWLESSTATWALMRDSAVQKSGAPKSLGKHWETDALLNCFQKWNCHFWVSIEGQKQRCTTLSSESLLSDIRSIWKWVCAKWFPLGWETRTDGFCRFPIFFPPRYMPTLQFMLCSFFRRQHGSWNCTRCPSCGRNSDGWIVMATGYSLQLYTLYTQKKSKNDSRATHQNRDGSILLRSFLFGCWPRL